MLVLLHGTRVVVAMLGMLIATGSAQAQSSPTVLEILPGSLLTIRGSTSIGAPWHCWSSDVDSRVAVATSSDDRNALPDVRGVTIHVAVSSLRCQSGAMEQSMRKALRVDRDTAARSISGRFEIPDALSPEDASERNLVGALRVAGVERNILLSARIARQADGSLRVSSVVPLTLSEFGITPPRVLFGAVRARNAIRVEVDLRYPHPSLAAVP